MEIYATTNKVVNFDLTQDVIDWILSLSDEDIKKRLNINTNYNEDLNFKDIFYICYEEGVFIDKDDILRKYYSDLINVISMNEVYHQNKINPINYQISEEIIKEVYKNMKDYQNKFKQATYFYFKLCFLLRQDIFYSLINFLCHSRILEFEKSIHTLKNMSISNNYACCFDFAATLNWLLNSIELLPVNFIDDKYGTANHSWTQFYYNGDLFSFDPWAFVEDTDLYNVKMKKPFKGIEILNCDNIKRKKQYYAEIEEVFLDVLKEIKPKQKDTFSVNGKNFLELIIDLLDDFPDKKKLKEYLFKLLNSHLKGEELKKFVHCEVSSLINEEFENFKMTTVCNTRNYGYTFIFAIKTNDNYKYVLIEDNGQISLSSRGNIFDSIVQGEFIISEDLYYIEGIDETIQFQAKQLHNQKFVTELLAKVKSGEIYDLPKPRSENDESRKRIKKNS